MANRADSDQLASSEANWSGSTLFAKAGYIWDQQDKGKPLIANQTCRRRHSKFFYYFLEKIRLKIFSKSIHMKCQVVFSPKINDINKDSELSATILLSA